MLNVENSLSNSAIAQPKKRSFFQRDENGQIALFVALIFQIIFVLFALVINVGLLVHHKINLQQSTDLAAYYGAMKQAEILNVIGHLNFQMRQSWKLFTWRYRILGSFGYKTTASSSDISGVPLQLNGTLINFDENKAKAKCTILPNSDQVGLHDLTPFCIGHNGFGDWGASATSSENTCDSDCTKVSAGAAQVNTIPQLSQAINVQGASVAGAIQTLIAQANATGQDLCRGSTISSLVQLANLMAAHFIDSQNRDQAIQLLMNGLVTPAEQMVDLDGELVKDGVLNTLKNNLTDANFKSLSPKPKLFNSTSMDNNFSGNECGSRQQLFHELKFQFVELLVNVCDTPAGALRRTRFLSLYENGSYSLNSVFSTIAASTPSNPVDLNQIKNIVQNEFRLGYEKNPWCQNYFGVRASTEPSIPFLPLAKIKLHASSFAKPFGGSIGPWFFSRWDRSADQSDSSVKQVDATMPPIKPPPGFGTTMADKMRMLPNFSNYVGDTEGTRDPMYQAIFHDFLLTRGLNRDTTNNASTSHAPWNTSPTLSKPVSGYPFYVNWRNVAKDVTEPDYDPMALDKSAVANSHIRDLEIAAIAPNQFDLAYYSIEPDFFNNYYKNRLDNNGPNRTVDKFRSLASGIGNVVFRPDFGYSQALSGSTANDYSVRHQLAVVEQIFKGDSSSTGISQLKANGTASSSAIIEKYFTFIPRFQGSLLTGWTYKDLVSQDGYTQFPNVSSGTKMPFATCNDPFPSTGSPNFGSLVEQSGQLPPAPGNCYSGGRTGYSVKIVNAAAINSAQGDIGGLGTGSGQIKNTIPIDFFDM